MVVALARALVERALDRFLDVPAPNQELIIGQVQIDVTEQHRGSRPGLEAQGRHAVLDGEGHLHWPTRPERGYQPAGSGSSENGAEKPITVTSGWPSPVTTLVRSRPRLQAVTN